MFTRSGRCPVPIHERQETRRGDPEAAPAPSRRSNWERAISIPGCSIGLKILFSFCMFATGGLVHATKRSLGSRQPQLGVAGRDCNPLPVATAADVLEGLVDQVDDPSLERAVMTLTLRPAGPSNVQRQSCTCTKAIPSGDTSTTPRKMIAQVVNVQLYFACALLCLQVLTPSEEGCLATDAGPIRRRGVVLSVPRATPRSSRPEQPRRLPESPRPPTRVAPEGCHARLLPR
jgi:hypothetical protein